MLVQRAALIFITVAAAFLSLNVCRPFEIEVFLLIIACRKLHFNKRWYRNGTILSEISFG